MNISLGQKCSFILHVVIMAILLFGLPHFSSNRYLSDDSAVTVQILPIAAKTNVKPSPKPKVRVKQKIPKPLTKNKPKIAMAKKSSKEAPKPVKTPIVKQKHKVKLQQEVIKPVEPAPKPKVRVEKKPPPKEIKKEVVKKDTKSFGAVLKTVEEFAQQDEEESEKDEKELDISEVEDFLGKSDNRAYKSGAPLSLSEKDFIRQQIMKNWTILGGAKNAKDIYVVLIIELSRTGEVIKVDYDNKSRYFADSFYKAIVDSAIRAVYKASPLQGLPPEKYDTRDGWRQIKLNFNPSEVVF